MSKTLWLWSLVLIVGGCVSRPKQTAVVEADKITVLSMNVENLFDTEDDPGKNDEAFLPASRKADPVLQNRCHFQNSSDYRTDECLTKDWSAKVLERKFNRLTDVLAQIEGGKGPDILILQEVENRRVLEMWRDRHLGPMNYQTIAHIEGPDERGIDTAVMSRLPMAGEPKLHIIDYSKAPELKPEDLRPTRGILETHLVLPDGTPITVFAVHFPAQAAPTIHRRVAVENLLELAAKVPAGQPVVVGGDFNITSKEEWQQKYFRNLLAPKFAVSHLVGCQSCVGTTYWHRDRTWSFFDVLLFSRDLDDSPSGHWQLDRQSIQVVNSSVYQIDRWGSPADFGNGLGSVGVTDHWPVLATLKRKADETKGVQ